MSDSGKEGEIARKTFSTLPIPDAPDKKTLNKLLPKKSILTSETTISFSLGSTKFLHGPGLQAYGVIVTKGDREPLSESGKW